MEFDKENLIIKLLEDHWFLDKFIYFHNYLGEKINLPSDCAYKRFAGETGIYQRQIAFSLLDRFHQDNIDSVIKASICELSDMGYDTYNDYLKGNPKNSQHYIINYGIGSMYWEEKHEKMGINENDFAKNPLFKSAIEKYGSNPEGVCPIFVALTIYANSDQLSRKYPFMTVWD